MTARRVIATVVLTLGLTVAACGSDGGEGEGAETGPSDAVTTVAATPTTGPAPSASGTTVAKATHARLGPILVDGAGLTLYTFDRDTRDDGYGTPAASACTGQCAETWPPVTVPAGTVLPTGAPGVSGLSTLSRDDGGVQVTVHGKALYRYAGDTKPGDANGDGIGGVWHVAKG